jgi:hypothetical protein
MDGDPVGPAIAAEDLLKYSSLSPGMGTTIRGLASLAPRTLAMHGPSFKGEGAAALHAWPMTTTAASPPRSGLHKKGPQHEPVRRSLRHVRPGHGAPLRGLLSRDGSAFAARSKT